MKREFTETLNNWFEYEKKPLVVVGARQIGKTYLINDYCKLTGLEYFYFNLEKDNWLFNIFEETIDPALIIQKLEYKLGNKISLEKSIFFFDEVQVSEKFIMSLKYFAEYESPIKIVCTGSLLGVKLNRFSSSFPVGKVIVENMYPMNFKEFAIAVDKQYLIEKIEESYKNKDKLDNILHEQATELYKIYLCIGGMPEMVLNYINNNKDILCVNRKILQNIVNAYLSDMTKYTSGKSESIKIEKVYKNIGIQLANENNTFLYSAVESGASKRNYELPINWLLSSNLVYDCNLVKLPQIPLSVYKSDNDFKLYLSDVGLLNQIVGIKLSEIMLDEIYMYKGAITENYVACELKNKGLDLLIYAKLCICMLMQSKIIC